MCDQFQTSKSNPQFGFRLSACLNQSCESTLMTLPDFLLPFSSYPFLFLWFLPSSFSLFSDTPLLESHFSPPLSLCLFFSSFRAEGRRNRPCPPRLERESQSQLQPNGPSLPPSCRPTFFSSRQSPSCLCFSPPAHLRVSQTPSFIRVLVESAAYVCQCLITATSLLSWASLLLSHQ